MGLGGTPAPGQETPPTAWPQTSILGTVETYEDGVVDVDGREDGMEELKYAGDVRDAQLEPGPENCFWQVVGSHQAGPVSHCSREEFRHYCGCS